MMRHRSHKIMPFFVFLPRKALSMPELSSEVSTLFVSDQPEKARARLEDLLEQLRRAKIFAELRIELCAGMPRKLFVTQSFLLTE